LTFADVVFSDDLSDGPHLKANKQVKSLARETLLVSGSAQTKLCVGESGFPGLHWQPTYLNAEPFNDRPALICRFAVIRQLELPRPWFVGGELVA
jgi:hypothetical protein